MSDNLISRQAAIEPKAISEWKKEFREYVDSLDITRDDWKGIIEYIDEIPSVQPERTETHSCDYERTATHGWIPVTERLPEEDYCTGRGIQHSESVLVTIVHHANDDDVFVDMACTVDGKWQLTYPIDDDPDIPKWCEIVAWMPLPEPYQAERREG